MLTHDTIEEFNVDSKAEYSALSSTRSQKNIKKKKLKQTSVPPFIREGSPEGIKEHKDYGVKEFCESD